MKLSYREWMFYRDTMKEELKGYSPTHDPKPIFSKLEFSFTYPITYPPDSVRMHFQYDEESQQLSGWREAAWCEGPFACRHIDFEEEYMIEVITPYLEKLKVTYKTYPLVSKEGR